MVPETFECFGNLKMEPPTTIDQVAGAVTALKAKKAEFAAMPRGQIKSIAEINHELAMKAENEKPVRSGGGGERSGGVTGAGGGSGGRGTKGGAGGGGKKAKNGGGGILKKPDAASISDFPALGGALKPATAAD